MRTRLVHIDVKSAATLCAALQAVVGFLAGIIVAMVLVFNASLLASEGDVQGMVVLGLAVAAVVGLPLLYGLLGFLIGALFTGVFNVVARRIGGVGLGFVEDEADV